MTFDFSLHPLDWAVIATYVVGIVLLGVWFGKFTKNTNDFFLGGQRFSWWVGSIACVATLIGSYSFMQYAQNGFNYGLASMTAYTNDWFVLPLFLLVWLPIVYYNRLTSIPEYFERRFDRRTPPGRIDHPGDLPARLHRVQPLFDRARLTEPAGRLADSLGGGDRRVDRGGDLCRRGDFRDDGGPAAGGVAPGGRTTRVPSRHPRGGWLRPFLGRAFDRPEVALRAVQFAEGIPFRR